MYKKEQSQSKYCTMETIVGDSGEMGWKMQCHSWPTCKISGPKSADLYYSLDT